MAENRKNLFPGLRGFIEKLNVSTVSDERKLKLRSLIDFLREKIEAKQPVRINFICTHNSRRSHLSQVWAQTFAAYFNISGVICYSGGTEATAVYPVVVETLEQAGFAIAGLSDSQNPVYSIKYGANETPVIGFSKTFDHPFNPKSDFAAVMTCSQADAGCPFIPGASKRISITYDDPKDFDGTPQQAQKYEERSLQIATELFYVFSQVQNS